MKNGSKNINKLILIALLNASTRHGINLTDWYDTKISDEMKINHESFLKKIKELEKNDLIKNALFNVNNHCLTEKGKIEALRLKSAVPLKDYKKIISIFPDIEMRDRISNIERFLLSITSILIISYLASTLSKNPNHISPNIVNFVVIIFLFLIIIDFSFLTSSLIKMFFFFTIDLKEDVFVRFRYWLWRNREALAMLVVVLSIIFVLVSVKTFIYPQISNEQIAASVILGIVVYLITNFQHIKNKLSKSVKAPFKKSK